MNRKFITGKGSKKKQMLKKRPGLFEKKKKRRLVLYYYIHLLTVLLRTVCAPLRTAAWFRAAQVEQEIDKREEEGERSQRQEEVKSPR